MKLPGELNLTAYRGASLDLVITFMKNDAPHNLTGTAQMKLYKLNSVVAYETIDLTITDNILTHSFTVAKVLEFARNGRYEIIFSEGANVTAKLRGSLEVENVQTSGSVVSGATVTLTETNLIAQVTEGIPGPKGDDGIAPEIGQNGNWFIGATDTGVQAQGDTGQDAFVYIAYASDDQGTGFTTTFNSALNYIAVLSTTTEIASPAVGDFAGLWKNYKGEKGETGDNGWTPVFATVSDGARRVLQVADWTGGEGTKPATGQFVGATGFEALIANGVDIRGEGLGTHEQTIANHDDVNLGDKTEGRGLLFDSEGNLVESPDTLATSKEVDSKALLPSILSKYRIFDIFEALYIGAWEALSGSASRIGPTNTNYRIVLQTGTTAESTYRLRVGFASGHQSNTTTQVQRIDFSRNFSILHTIAVSHSDADHISSLLTTIPTNDFSLLENIGLGITIKNGRVFLATYQTTLNEVDSGVDLLPNNTYDIRIDFLPSERVDLYINNVLETTTSDQLPSGNPQCMPLLVLHENGASEVNNMLSLYESKFLQKR